MKIILVEEDPDVCELLAKLLRDALGPKHTVITFDSITPPPMTEIVRHHSDAAATFISHGRDQIGAMAGGYLKGTVPEMKVVLMSTIDAQTVAHNYDLDYFMFKKDFFPIESLRFVLGVIGLHW